MQLHTMTSSSLCLARRNYTSREEILRAGIDALVKAGIVTDAGAYYTAVMNREAESETGFENGVAIPHGKSKAVSRAAFVVITLAKPLPVGAWPSLMEGNAVDTIILLAVPEAEAGSTHLDLLSKLSIQLMNENFVRKVKAASTNEELYRCLQDVDAAAAAGAAATVGAAAAGARARRVVAVTACATGIAHTYMAAEALEKAAAEMGIGIKVEKQGASGFDGKLTKQEIAEADGVLFAVDVNVKEKERFIGKQYVEVKVAEPLKRSKELLTAVLERPMGTISGDAGAIEESTTGSEKPFAIIMKAIMNGISHMIPLLVASGLMLGIAKLVWLFGLRMDVADIGNVTWATAGGLPQFFHFLDAFGNMLMKFLYPVFALYVAYSIADKSGIVAGLAGGLFAAGLHFAFYGIEGGIPSGFLGALVLGLAAGFICKFLNDHIRLSKNLAAMKPMFLVPGISVLLIFMLNLLIVDPVFGGLNLIIENWIESMGEASKLGLSAIIAAATAFDLGGPINKAAGAVAIGMAADHIFPLTPRVLAIIIPPIGLGLSTFLDRPILRRSVYDEDLRMAGRTSFLLGFLAISEGGIPFMLKNPLITVPINVIGAIVGACTAVALGAVQWLPLPAVWGWPLVENLPAYLLGLAIGVAIVAFGNIFVRAFFIARKERRMGGANEKDICDTPRPLG